MSREEIATLPTVSGRINDITRLTPQASGMSFAGQDNRLNNITVDGSYFNNSFGLAGAPGERTGVAPISLEAIEQVQVNVAPFDVRQGNFVGAGVNTVTRSGTNRFTGSVYHRFRNEDFVGTEAKGLPFNPGHVQLPQHRRLGRRADRQEQAVRLRQLRGRRGHAAADDVPRQHGRRAGRRQHDSRARVGPRLRSARSSHSDFNYETGPFEDYRRPDAGQALPAPQRLQPQQQQQGQLPLQPPRLDHRRRSVELVGRSAAAADRTRTNFLSFQNSNYQMLENIRSGIGEWNSIHRQRACRTA